MGSVAVLGSINLDYVITVDTHPLPGETVLGKEVHKAAGGKGANQAVAAARLGASVRMYGLVGDDDVGRDLVEGLRNEGIDSSGLGHAEVMSGAAYLTVAASGENSIIVIPGANALVGDMQVEQLLAGLGAEDVVVMQLEIPISTVHAAVAGVRRAGARVVLNAAPGQDVGELLSLIDVLVVNETEASILAHRRIGDVASATGAAQALQAKFGLAVVVTLGPRGAVVVDGGAVHHVPSIPVAVVDTTGAGDTFVGALAAMLAEGAALEPAVRFATRAAAAACRSLGARAGMPHRADLPPEGAATLSSLSN